MTENDEGAVIPTTTVSWDLYQAVCDGLSKANMERDSLRSQLAAAESKALAVHEVLGKERDQALARLGEADRLLRASFLARDSAGGMG
jgi:hypothetical protein